MRVPIACSLTETAARSQGDEWRDVIVSSVATMDRASQTELVLRLRLDAGSVGSLIELAQREKACCAFFEFALLIDADALSLRVTVPEDAAAILDDFARTP